MIDINYDKMQETDLKNCKILSEYSFVVDTVRKYNGDVERAVKECIEKGVLADYLRHYGIEVVNMLFEEYNAEKALEIKGKEEYEKGLEQGQAKMIKMYYQVEKNIKKIADTFKMTETEVNRFLAMNVI